MDWVMCTSNISLNFQWASCIHSYAKFSIFMVCRLWSLIFNYTAFHMLNCLKSWARRSWQWQLTTQCHTVIQGWEIWNLISIGNGKWTKNILIKIWAQISISQQYRSLILSNLIGFNSLPEHMQESKRHRYANIQRRKLQFCRSY